MSHALQDKLALDRASVRTKDIDGKLHVAFVNMTKACVSPYLGREIPDYERLGLQPDRVYRLYRDADALEKAVPTANNLPVLSKHKPVSADDPPKDLIVGSTGTDAKWAAPFITNNLVIWDADLINLIESDRQKELSAGYRYRPIMEPVTVNGERADGRMVDIVFNHLAVVVEGRVGKQAIIGDSKMEQPRMKPLDRKAAMKATFPVAKIEAAKTLLAQDADLADLARLLDAFSGGPAEGGEDPLAEGGGDPAMMGEGAEDPAVDDEDPAAPPEMGAEGEGDPAASGDPVEAVKAFLAGKLSPEDMQQLDALVAKIGGGGEAAAPGAEAEAEGGEEPVGEAGGEVDKPAEGGAPPAAEASADPGKDKQAKDKENPMVTKPAMDAAIARAVAAERENQKAIRKALSDVRPFVGELAMTFDSADGVYRHALKAMNVPGVDKVKDSASLPILLAAYRPAAPRAPALAQDSAADADYVKRFPNADRLAR